MHLPPILQSSRTWAQIDLNAIVHNLGVVRRANPGAMLIPVVKAGAYGHGLEPVARVLEQEGLAFFGVANVGEARRLAHASIRTKPYILGPTLLEEREEIVINGWQTFASTLDDIEHFNSLGQKCGKIVPLHLAFDLGMGRGGFLPSQLPELPSLIKSCHHVCINGVSSHLPSADEDEAATRQQIATFDSIVATLSPHFQLTYRHLANSAAAMAFSVPTANAIRPGLVLYGVSPVATPWQDELRPTLSLYSRITLIRELPAGQSISYGQTYRTTTSTKIATVGIGYADGLPRILARNGVCLSVHGILCPVLGRVTMDQVVIDVSHVPHAQLGDVVEVIGPHIPITTLATQAETIPWEIFTGIGPRVYRYYNS